MNEQQLEEFKEYEWDKFSRRYPIVTGKNLICKIMFLFRRIDTTKLVWEDGFLQGYMKGITDMKDRL